MPRNITVYRVFIGSPGGLDAERERFRDVLEKYNRVHARRHDIEFEPVGWEDTLPSGGRPQAQINADLERCDYALFAFHDRWGSPTGNGDLVGTEEEWEIAQRLHSAEGGYQIRHIALYFKAVPAAQLKDPGEELRKVLAFKAKVFAGKQHLCGGFTEADEFAAKIEVHLADWLARHLQPATETSYAGIDPSPRDAATSASPTFTPNFDFWVSEAKALLRDDPSNRIVLLSQFEKALLVASSAEQTAIALFNKAVTLQTLDRSAEAISAYDELIARFGASDAGPLQEQVAMALVNKGIALGALDRSAEEIAVYDELIARFGTSDRVALQERVAKAIYNKGCAFGSLSRIAEEITVYDEVIARFGTIDVAALQELVAKALFNKSCALAMQERVADCIQALDQWAEKRGSFDCEEIAKDSDFDAIRAQPKFVKYLKSKGCNI